MNNYLQQKSLAQKLAISACLFIALSACILGLLFGSVANADWDLIIQLRLPRVLIAFCVGALLATSGNLLQIFTRNPLAEPSVLGISAGASVGAVLAMVLGLTVWIGAWIGAVIILGLLWYLAGGFTGSSERLLLAGVMLATACGAIISVILSMSSQRMLPGIIHWLMGDLQGVLTWQFALMIFLSTIVLVVFLSVYANSIQLIPLGWDKLISLGVNVTYLKVILIGGCSLAIAISVSIAGMIGFIGLVVPHVLRLFSRDILAAHQSWMIPSCALLGGVFLVLADLISRTVLAPSELPIGVVTAAIGVPVFLYLLNRQDVWRSS